MQEWERAFESFVVRGVLSAADAAHDLGHVHRVVASARALARAEGADLAVVLPAAWLHDCVQHPKTGSARADASRAAAGAAGAFLRDAGYPEESIAAIEHAIHAHSFSARVPPQTLEASVVQDADRLDALGALGIARTLLLGGALGSTLYEPGDPFAHDRPLDDRRYVLDHFFAKLLHLAGGMRTLSGRAEAERRTDFMREYLVQLAREIGVSPGRPEDAPSDTEEPAP